MYIVFSFQPMNHFTSPVYTTKDPASKYGNVFWICEWHKLVRISVHNTLSNCYTVFNCDQGNKNLIWQPAWRWRFSRRAFCVHKQGACYSFLTAREMGTKLLYVFYNTTHFPATKIFQLVFVTLRYEVFIWWNSNKKVTMILSHNVVRALLGVEGTILRGKLRFVLDFWWLLIALMGDSQEQQQVYNYQRQTHAPSKLLFLYHTIFSFKEF